MSGSVLVAGIGNMFLGDDGFGPEVARQLACGQLPRDVRAVDYGIRGMHLAYDLLGDCAALVLVDTVPARSPAAPGTLHVLEISQDDLPDAQLDAHGMDPAAVLSQLASLGGSLPEPTIVVGCEPADLGEGIGLSAPVQAAVPRAVETVLRIVRELVAQESGAR